MSRRERARNYRSGIGWLIVTAVRSSCPPAKLSLLLIGGEPLVHGGSNVLYVLNRGEFHGADVARRLTCIKISDTEA